LLVADGMGGAPAGDVASSLVVEAFERRPKADVEPLAYLGQAVEDARRAISSSVAEHPERAGMGSTVAVAFVRDGRVWVGNIGDSRAYLWQNGELRQLSEDHSVVAQSVREGWIDRKTVHLDPQRHMLTRVIGGLTSADQGPLYNSEPAELDGSSAVLLVTDGVSGVISEDEVQASIEQYCGDELVGELIRRVHAAGAPDNIGIALLDERA
jgi:protein phosphatase